MLGLHLFAAPARHSIRALDASSIKMVIKYQKRILLVLLLSCISLNAQTSSRSAISGKVIDARGKPVGRAVVIVTSPPARSHKWVAHDMIMGVASDGEGIFRFEDTNPVVTLRRLLFTYAPIPQNVYALLTPPNETLTGTNPRFRGRVIFVDKNKEVNLGDVPLQIHFLPIQFILQNAAGNPLQMDKDEW